MTAVTEPAVTTEVTETIVHALYSSWSKAECGEETGWNRAFYAGGINCPACLKALPKKAAGEAAAVTR